MVESCSKQPSLFVFYVFAKVSSWHFAALCVLPFYPNVVPARESHPGVSFSLVRSYRGITSPENISHSDGHSVVGCRKNKKEPITQSIKNRREHNSRFKVMFYVIGSENQSRVLLSTAPANRTKGVVEQFGTSGVPIPCRMDRPMVEHWYSVVPPLYRYITYPSSF